eukprot:258673_1
MDTHKRWTHGISGAVLRIIFEMCTFGLRNKTILILLQVCKRWRDIIMSVDSQTSLDRLWSGCLPCAQFQWKHLVLIPKRYLQLVVDIEDAVLEPFTQQENRIYRALCVRYMWIEIIYIYEGQVS